MIKNELLLPLCFFLLLVFINGKNFYGFMVLLTGLVVVSKLKNPKYAMIFVLMWGIMFSSSKYSENFQNTPNEDNKIPSFIPSVGTTDINDTTLLPLRLKIKNQSKTYNLNMDKNNLFSDIYKHKLMRTIKCTIKYRVVQSILIMGFLTFFIYRSFYLLKNSKIEKAIFYTSLIVMKQVIGNFIHAIDMCRDATVEWDILQYTGFFNTNDLYKNRKKESVKPSCKNTEIVDKNVLLDMQNVSFKYSKQKNYILENVNWSVSRGDKIALVGDIGSGKSTLLKLILKIINPVKGHIYLNGQNYSSISAKELHNMIGFMPQNCVLFNRTLIENIQYGNKRKITETEVLQLLEKHNIKTFDHLDNGLKFVCGKNGNYLSGGQRQLVWFIRMYFAHPHIILLDEPTASLDENAKDILLRLINKLLIDKTTVIITHDPYMIDNIKHVVNINSIKK